MIFNNKPLAEMLRGDLARLQEIHTTIPSDNERIGALIGRLDVVFIHLSDHFLSVGDPETAHAIQLIAVEMNKCALPNEALPDPWRQPTEEEIAAAARAEFPTVSDETTLCCVCGTRAAKQQCPGCKGYFCDPHYTEHVRDNAPYLESEARNA